MITNIKILEMEEVLDKIFDLYHLSMTKYWMITNIVVLCENVCNVCV